MSKFKFEGNVDGLSEEQFELISNVLQERGFTDGKVLVQGVGEVGDNYVANVKRISVDKDGKVFKMIAKVAPTNEGVRMTINANMMFNNEHVMYSDFMAKFAELEKAANVPKEYRLRHAEYYGSLLIAPYEIILLEDLKESDFTMLDRLVSLSDDTVKLVLKNFAILHSLAFALKNKEPETFDKLKNKLLNMWALISHIPQALEQFRVLEDDILKLTENDTYKALIKGSVSQLPILGAKSDDDDKYSIIQQGDAWTNNIMFKFKDNKVNECCMIDYQVSKPSNPVNDLFYMIFNCTDYEIRSKHYHEWIDYYHAELTKALSNFGLEAKSVYPRDQLDADLKKYSRLSFAAILVLQSVLMRDPEDAAKMKELMEKMADEGIDIEKEMEKASISGGNEQLIKRFKSRLDGVLKSFIELKYDLEW